MNGPEPSGAGAPWSRRRLLAAGATSAVLPWGRARGQGSLTPRIAMLLFRGWEDASLGFREYLEGAGFQPEYTVYDMNRDPTRIAPAVAEVKATQPDLVYLWGTSTAVGALGPWDAPDPARHLTTERAVFNIVTEPVGNGIIKSLDDPGRACTGTLYIVPIPTQLRTMARYRPFQRLGLVYNPLERNSLLTLQSLRTAAGELGMEVLDRPAPLDDTGRPRAEAIPRLVKELKGDGAEWLYIPPDSFLQANRRLLTAAALAQRLPSFTSTEPYIREADALFGLVCRYHSIGQMTAAKAERILRDGVDPRSLPVETLKRFSLLVNVGVARSLNLWPPMALLSIAEAV